MARFVVTLCFVLWAGLAWAQDAKCNFRVILDKESSAFQALADAGIKQRGFWRSISTAPDDVRELAKFVGRLAVCVSTPDGKPRQVLTSRGYVTVNSPHMFHCTGTLLDDGRLLTNHHCYFQQNFVDAGFVNIKKAKVIFGYVANDDLSGIKRFDVDPTPLAKDKETDSLVLAVRGSPADLLGGHFSFETSPHIASRQALTMIHHPKGGPLQWSSGTCQVHQDQGLLSPSATVLRHTCETTGGSSGALLLDARSLRVVGLHNQGGLRPNGEGFNSGHRIEAVALGLGLKGEPKPNPLPIPDKPLDGEALIAAIQSKLNAHNCSVGSVDGSFGPASVRAVLMYNRLRPANCEAVPTLEKVYRGKQDSKFVTDGNRAVVALQSCAAPACGQLAPSGYAVDFRAGCFYEVYHPASGEYAEWTGRCDDNGYASGNGTLRYVYPEGAPDSYYKTEAGTMCGGALCGQGRIERRDGREISGEFLRGKLNGQGRYEYANGEIYVGAFKNNKRHGQGRTSHPNGWSYEGDFLEGARHGYGVHVVPGGRVQYRGAFRNSQYHGEGTYTFSNGTTWTGTFRNGQLHGWGTANDGNGQFRALYENDKFIRSE